MRLALIALTLLLMPTGAEAQSEDRPNWRSVRQKQWVCRDWGGCGYEWRWRRVRIAYPNHTYRLIDQDQREYGYRAPEGEVQRVRAHCLWDEPPVQIGGEDKLDQTRAETSAQENWQREVERRTGTIYSDIRYAAQISMACIRKVPSTLTQSVQAAGGLWHYVCEMTAVPCKVPPERQDEDSRAKRKSERADDETGRRADPRPRVDYYEAPPPPKGWREKWRRWRGRD